MKISGIVRDLVLAFLLGLVPLPFSLQPLAATEPLVDQLTNYGAAAGEEQSKLRDELARLAENRMAEVYRNLSDTESNWAIAKTALQDFEAISRVIYQPNSKDRALALFNTGWAYHKLSREYEALQLYVESLETAENALADDDILLADVKLVIGEGFMDNGIGTAEPILLHALEIYRSHLGEDNWFVARTLEDLGSLHRLYGKLEDAEAHLLRAKRIYESLPEADDTRTLSTLRNLAWVYQYQGRYSEAKATWEHVLAYVANRESIQSLQCSEYWLGPLKLPVDRTTVTKCGMDALVSWKISAYDGLGNLHRFYERYPEAYSYFDKQLRLTVKSLTERQTRMSWSEAWMAVDLGRQRDLIANIAEPYQSTIEDRGLDHPLNAYLFRSVATLHGLVGNYARAEEGLKYALQLFTRYAPHEVVDIAYTLNQLADLHRRFGDYVQAKNFYDAALRAFALVDKSSPASEGYWQDSSSLYLGKLHQSVGQYKEAEESYQAALHATTKYRGGDSIFTARQHLELAEFYASINDNSTAIEHLSKYLEVHHRFWGRQGSALRYQAKMARWQGDLDEAAATMTEAVEWIKKNHQPESALRAEYLKELAEIYAAQGANAPAEKLYKELLDGRFYRTTDTPEEALLLNSLANCLLALGKTKDAKTYAQLALSLAARYENPELLWRTEHTLSRVLSRAGNTEPAVLLGKQAVNNLQTLRSQIANLEVATQQSYLESRSNVYRDLADLLIDLGRLPEAHQVIAMLKQEELFEYLRRSGQTDQDVSRMPYARNELEWKARYDLIEDKLASIGTEIESLRSKKRQNQISRQDNVRLQQLESDLAISQTAFTSYLDDIGQAFRQMGVDRAIEFGRKDLDSLKSLQGSLQRLGHGATLIHFLVTSDRLRILVTTPSVQIHRDSPVRESEISRLVFEYREVLQNPRSNPLELSRALYELMFAPIAQDLVNANTQLLMVSLDASLRYVPVHALHDGEMYLGQRYATALFTPATRVGLEVQPSANWSIAAFGSTRGSEDLTPLPSVGEELRSIVRESDDDPDGLLPGIVRLNDQFTAEQLESALNRAEGDYEVVHIASHFVFSPGTEADSFLLLGDGSELTLKAIKAGNFSFYNVDLLTLSACDTAVSSSGSEIESFGALAQNQGARGVLATLWPVVDGTTATFMQVFYRARSEDGQNKAEALRTAQSSFINSEGGLAHPFYWAPFVLIGNWL